MWSWSLLIQLPVSLSQSELGEERARGNIEGRTVPHRLKSPSENASYAVTLPHDLRIEVKHLIS